MKSSLFLTFLTALVGINAVSATFPLQQSRYQKVTQNNEPILDTYGVHEAVALGNDIFMFGGIRENRTIFWQENTAFVEFYADTRKFNPYTGLYSRIDTVDGVEPDVRCWFGADSNGHDKAYIYGGLGPNFVNRNDFWIYDKNLNKWIQKGPVTNSALSATKDFEQLDSNEITEARQVMADALLANQKGQSNQQSKENVKKAAAKLQNHYRHVQFNTRSNNEVLTSNPQEYPGALNGPGIVYDDDNEEIILFGGLTPDFVTANNEVYKYDLNTETWTRLARAANSPAPLGRTLPEVALRKTQGGNKRELIMYGGEAFFFDFQYYRYICDMWVFDIDAQKWTELIPREDDLTEAEKSHVPVCRLHYAAVYDPWIDQMHFHGGDYGNCTCTDLITSRTMVYDFPTQKLVDDVYESTSTCDYGFFGDTQCELRNGHLDPRLKRAKFTRFPNGKVFMTGGYVAEEPGNVDQRYPSEVYQYRPRNWETIRLKFGYVEPTRIPQEVNCPANDEEIC